MKSNREDSAAWPPDQFSEPETMTAPVLRGAAGSQPAPSITSGAEVDGARPKLNATVQLSVGEPSR
jgi:hypothetical protein